MKAEAEVHLQASGPMGRSPQRLQKETTLLTFRFQTRGFQRHERITFVTSSHRICGNWLWQAYARNSLPLCEDLPRGLPQLLPEVTPFLWQHCIWWHGPWGIKTCHFSLSLRQLWRSVFTSELPTGLTKASPISPLLRFASSSFSQVWVPNSCPPAPTFCVSLCFQRTQPAPQKKHTPLPYSKSY